MRAQQHAEQQESTFTRFINVYLTDHERSITDLRELSTGVELFFVLKSIHDRQGTDFAVFSKLETKRIRMQIVQKSNVQSILSYLESQGVVLHGINSVSIVSKDLKIIMGLVWRIIGKYLVGEDESEEAAASGTAKRASSPYNVILRWVNERIKVFGGLQIGSVEDWTSGKALFALATICSRSIPQQDERDAFIEAGQGLSGRDLLLHTFEFATNMLHIPEVCTVDEFVNPEKMSITTYVSFYKKFWKDMHEDQVDARGQLEDLQDEVAEERKMRRDVAQKLGETDVEARTLRTSRDILKQTVDDLMGHVETLGGFLVREREEKAKLVERIRLLEEEKTRTDEELRSVRNDLETSNRTVQKNQKQIENLFLFVETATGTPYGGQSRRLNPEEEEEGGGEGEEELEELDPES